MTTLADHPTEPRDPGARVVSVDTKAVETMWARHTTTGRWFPLGKTGSYNWWALRHLYPTAELVLPAVETGKVIPARRTDPATSKAATPPTVRAGTQRAALLAAFTDPGAGAAPDGSRERDGLTDEQAARLADGVSMSSEYAKRCSELREAGLIAPTGETRTGIAGAARIVSRITDQGRTILSRLNENA